MRNMYGYNEDSNLEKYGDLKDDIGSIMKSNLKIVLCACRTILLYYLNIHFMKFLFYVLQLT